MTIRTLAVALICLLPMSPRKQRMLNALGHEIADGASVAPCFVWQVERIVIGPGSVVRAFAVIAGLRRLDIGANTILGSWNRITSSAPRGGAAGEAGTFRMGDEAALTARHELDATGGISIGSFSGIGGVRTSVITSAPDPRDPGALVVAPVRIGDYCLINTNCTLLPGAVVEDRVIVGAHSTIEGTMRSDGLYLSARARRVRAEADPAAQS